MNNEEKNTILAIIDNAMKLIQIGHCKDVNARDHLLRAISELDHNACYYCLSGALWRGYYECLPDTQKQKLLNLRHEIYTGALEFPLVDEFPLVYDILQTLNQITCNIQKGIVFATDFNDLIETNKEDVIEALAKARNAFASL
jgi:hypothetical protein